MESRREHTKNKTFTMYPSTFEKLKALAKVSKVSNSEMIEILINDEFEIFKKGGKDDET